MKKIILVDQDGVLADWDAFLLTRLKTNYPHIQPVEFEKRVHFHADLDYEDEEAKKIVREIPHAPRFYANLPLIDGAVEALNKMLEMDFEVRICTTPEANYENCVKEKYEWIEKNFSREWTKRLILTRDKTIVHGDILIDDKPEITGAIMPSWTQVFFDMPYNRFNTYSIRPRLKSWKNWESVILPLLHRSTVS